MAERKSRPTSRVKVPEGVAMKGLEGALIGAFLGALGAVGLAFYQENKPTQPSLAIPTKYIQSNPDLHRSLTRMASYRKCNPEIFDGLVERIDQLCGLSAVVFDKQSPKKGYYLSKAQRLGNEIDVGLSSLEFEIDRAPELISASLRCKFQENAQDLGELVGHIVHNIKVHIKRLVISGELQ